MAGGRGTKTDGDDATSLPDSDPGVDTAKRWRKKLVDKMVGAGLVNEDRLTFTLMATKDRKEYVERRKKEDPNVSNRRLAKETGASRQMIDADVREMSGQNQPPSGQNQPPTSSKSKKPDLQVIDGGQQSETGSNVPSAEQSAEERDMGIPISVASAFMNALVVIGTNVSMRPKAGIPVIENT
jgi:hypothetical protein